MAKRRSLTANPAAPIDAAAKSVTAKAEGRLPEPVNLISATSSLNLLARISLSIFCKTGDKLLPASLLLLELDSVICAPHQAA